MWNSAHTPYCLPPHILVVEFTGFEVRPVLHKQFHEPFVSTQAADSRQAGNPYEA